MRRWKWVEGAVYELMGDSFAHQFVEAGGVKYPQAALNQFRRKEVIS
jgi:hypothetical protein